MGDTIDNVKGVPGIGDKGARELISTYGNLDALLEHAAEVKQKKYREALLAHAAEAHASRELVRIHTDVPVAFNISDFRYTGPAQAACYALFSELGFSSLMMEYAPTAETTTKDYRLVTTSAELQALVEELRRAGRFAFRVFGDGSAAVTSSIIGLAVAPGGNAARVARYLPLRHQGMHTGPQLTADEALRALAPLLEDASIEKIGHDLKTDAVVLAHHGVTLNGLGLDTMLASYLLDAARSGHSLETAALEHLGYKALTEEDVCGKGAKAIALADTPPDAVLTYACERADLALQLADRLSPALVTEQLDAVYRDLERPLIPVLVADGARRRPDRRRGARRAIAAVRARARHAQHADLRARRRAVQHQLAAAALAHPVREAAAAGAQAQRQDRRPRPRRRPCSKSWRSCTSCRASFSSGASCRS